MDRRTLFSTLLKRQQLETIMMSPPTTNAGLTRYTGPWEYDQAAHLLRRSMFGPSNTDIKWAVENKLEGTIEKLFEDLPLPSPPVNTYYKNDPNVPIGASWINAPYSRTTLTQQMNNRYMSITGWTMGLMLNEGISIREKMTLFWHNHFPINAILDSKFLYRYITLLRTHATGNFRTLTKAVTIDPSMLTFLNGNRNYKEAPNENYARELLELFTIGKGPLVAEGDYTNYTEEDVKEIARALSGWGDYGATIESTDGTFGVFFKQSLHDRGVKHLSHRFGNAEIRDMGDREYAHVIDVIFQQAEVARFICRRLYRWFVYYHINDLVEENVIQPMAELVLEHDFELKPALKALLSSEHFFDKVFQGAMIKHPIDFIMSIFKPLHIKISDDPNEMYHSWYALFGFARLMQMEYYNIPDVAGWRSYYIAPVYYRNWINATTLPYRSEFASYTVREGYFPYRAIGPQMKPDMLQFISTLTQPDDPNLLIEEMAKILLPQPLTEREKKALKEILIPGLPDFEWGVEYRMYLENPADSQLASSLDSKLRSLVVALFNKAAFQLC